MFYFVMLSVQLTLSFRVATIVTRDAQYLHFPDSENLLNVLDLKLSTRKCFVCVFENIVV